MDFGDGPVLENCPVVTLFLEIIWSALCQTDLILKTFLKFDFHSPSGQVQLDKIMFSDLAYNQFKHQNIIFWF